ncbi:rho GTPase-activating protein 12-like, partial [Tropilaelaps mercedesae]
MISSTKRRSRHLSDDGPSVIIKGPIRWTLDTRDSTGGYRVRRSAPAPDATRWVGVTRRRVTARQCGGENGKVYDDISGSMYFTNELNDERWCSSQDSDGRVYFYQEGTQRTAWELPKVAPCPPQRLKKQLEDDCSKTVLRHNEAEGSGATILRTKTLPTGGSGQSVPKGGSASRSGGHPVTSSLSNSNIAAMDSVQQRANKTLQQQHQQML